MTDKTQVNFRFPNELIDALKTRADKENISMTELTVRLLSAGLEVALPSKADTYITYGKASSDSIASIIAGHIAPLQEELAAYGERIAALEKPQA